MTTDEQLRELLKREGTAKASLHWVEVLNVNDENGTMDVKGVADDLEYYDVSLGCGSIVMIPERGSTCVIAIVEGVDTECMLISAERIQRLKITASTEIILNGGALGGLVKVQELTDVLNGMIQAYNGHTHTVTGVQPGSGTAIVPATSKRMNTLKRETLENKMIKQ